MKPARCLSRTRPALKIYVVADEFSNFLAFACYVQWQVFTEKTKSGDSIEGLSAFKTADMAGSRSGDA